MNKNEGIVRLNIGYHTMLVILLRVSSDEIYVINEDDKKTQAYNSLKQCCAFSNITRLSDLIIF